MCPVGESKKLRFIEHQQHLNGAKGLIEILDREKGKLRATSQPAVSPTSWANQVKEIADDLKCLTQLASKVPSMQIQAWSMLSTAKDPVALFNPCTVNLAILGILSAVKSETMYTTFYTEEQAWTLSSLAPLFSVKCLEKGSAVSTVQEAVLPCKKYLQGLSSKCVSNNL